MGKLKTVWVVELKDTDDGDVYFELPIDLLKKLGWNLGDTLECSNSDDGMILIKK